MKCAFFVLQMTVGLEKRNIVSTVNLDCKLDLKAIALQARNAEYNPKVQNCPTSSVQHLYFTLATFLF